MVIVFLATYMDDSNNQDKPDTLKLHKRNNKIKPMVEKLDQIHLAAERYAHSPAQSRPLRVQRPRLRYRVRS